jgi:proton glutamate symport protein
MNPLRWKLHWQILASLALAIVVGSLINQSSPSWAGQANEGIGFFGKLFLNALKMVVVPLVASSIVLGVINIGADKDFGRLGMKTLVFYVLSSFLAILVGLLIVNAIKPGDVDPTIREKMLAQAGGAEQEKIAGAIENAEQGSRGLFDIFIRMIPTNIVQAGAEGDLLGIIFFSILFGFFTSRLPDGMRGIQLGFWESFNTVMIRLTQFIISFAPIGVFGLVCPTISETGWDLFAVMVKFAGTVLLALGTHFFLTLPIMLKVIGKIPNPIRHYQAMSPALLTAFSTASSSSTLPLTMQCVQENAGVSKKVSGFTLPLGATVNMDGTALYECVVVIFLAQLFGIPMDFTTQFQVVLLALLTSIGVAGIPSASLVAIIIILNSTGFEKEYIPIGIGIVMVVDRILDMLRTAVNVFGDSCCAVVIAKTEGEQGILE